MKFLKTFNKLLAAVLLTTVIISCGGDDNAETPAPTISGFTPTSGEVGASVTINGTNFSTTPANNEVKFGSVTATVTAATATSLTTTVPAGATTGKISVTVNDKTAISAADFTVNFAPSISNFTPTSGTAGTSVTITGLNFSTTASQNTVRFNGVQATVTAATATTLTVTVPVATSTGKISVQVGSSTANSATDFQIIPVIASFAPSLGNVGSNVTITGTNFSTTAANNIVKFNGTAATVSTATASSLTVVVPVGATTGKITVEVATQIATSATDYTVTLPLVIVTGFIPNQGAVGTTVNISGNNFSTNPANNIVRFNGVLATVTAASQSNLTVTVPSGASTGIVSVQVGSQTANSSANFLIPAPTVSSFTPIQGGVGTVVILTGTNFSPILTENVVRFGCASCATAEVVQASTTSLTVRVPVGAVTGGIAVVTGGNAAALTSSFTIVSNYWRKMANLPANGRFGAAGFAIGDKGYIGTGFGVGGKFKDLWEFDPLNNTWTQKANLPGEARQYSVGFAIGNKGYIGLGVAGASNTQAKDLWEYDPITNSWTQKADFGGSGRHGAIAFVVGSKAYVGTGRTSLSATVTHVKDFWEYNPATNSWTQKADFAGTARAFAAAFAIGNKGYVGTGNDGAFKNDFYEYDPGTDAWTAKANFGGSAREAANAFALDYNSRGYIGWGYSGSDFTGGLWRLDTWEYNPTTNAWAQKVTFNAVARSNGVGFAIGMKGYFLTGMVANATNSNEIYELTP
ncbi:MAG: hypothetical protein EBR30_17660 [Cytophagia bacterium]|nr:hypothetical protein [Cytophagia bacterium]NBW36812.1 hypothetical protein [Cytophagia bacterium]